MMLVGFLCLLWNMRMTASAGTRYEEEQHLVPAEAN